MVGEKRLPKDLVISRNPACGRQGHSGQSVPTVLGEPYSSSQGSGGAIAGEEAGEEPLRTASGSKSPCPSTPQRSVFVSLFLSSLTTPQHSSPGQGEANRHRALCVWGGMCPPPSTRRTQCPFCSLCSPSPPPLNRTCQAAIGYLLRTAPSYQGPGAF